MLGSFLSDLLCPRRKDRHRLWFKSNTVWLVTLPEEWRAGVHPGKQQSLKTMEPNVGLEPMILKLHLICDDEANRPTAAPMLATLTYMKPNAVSIWCLSLFWIQSLKITDQQHPHRYNAFLSIISNIIHIFHFFAAPPSKHYKFLLHFSLLSFLWNISWLNFWTNVNKFVTGESCSFSRGS